MSLGKMYIPLMRQPGSRTDQPYISSDFEPDNIDVVLPEEVFTAR